VGHGAAGIAIRDGKKFLARLRISKGVEQGDGMIEGGLDGARAGDGEIDLAEFIGDGVIMLGADGEWEEEAAE
jgi:hypothetical protein